MNSAKLYEDNYENEISDYLGGEFPRSSISKKYSFEAVKVAFAISLILGILFTICLLTVNEIGFQKEIKVAVSFSSVLGFLCVVFFLLSREN